ncbi:MAG TPA: hypothetical protein VJ969_04705, partial [Desulfopila sp.]|nr:hypothetical protein [Desulfopila sp.]
MKTGNMKTTIKRYHRRRYMTRLSSVVLGIVFLAATSTLADEAEGTVETVEMAESYYQNPAQAAHAAQLAEEAALDNVGVQAALGELEALQNTLDAQAEPATEEQLTELANLQDDYMNELAGITGLLAEDIEGMRTSGMGWGEIAHALNVHPSVLGLGRGWGVGKAKKSADFSADELAETTVRNTRNHAAGGHGLGGGSKSGNSNAGGLGGGSKSGNSNAGGLGGGSKSGNSNAGGLGGGSKSGN